MSGRLVVALDGPASSGKSSVGAAAAAELGYRFFDTGLLYRALTWLAGERGVEATDPAALVELVDALELGLDEAGRLSRVVVGGVEVTDGLRSPAVDAAVSAISAVPEVRIALLERQRRIAAEGGIVMAGRDIGTVVLPDADLKLFLDASAEERARRRTEQRGLDPAGAEAAAILEALHRRDGLDAGRAVAPLRAAPDAVHLRTDGNAFEETVGLVVDAIRSAEARRGREPNAPTTPTAPADIPPAPREGGITPVIWIGTLIARFVTRAVTRYRLEGAIDEIPRSGAVLFAANHTSSADPVVIGAFLTQRLGRRIHWLGKREVFETPILGWLAREGAVHPVDRSGADIEAFRTARRILDDGNILAVFPEGTRSLDGQLGEAKDGVALLALRTGAPIVPIGVAGSHRAWPKGHRMPRFGQRITVRVGPPFRLDEAPPAGRTGRVKGAKTEATKAIMGRIAALLPPDQRGNWASEDAGDGPSAEPPAAISAPDA